MESLTISAWTEKPAAKHSLSPDNDDEDDENFLPRRRFDPRRSKLHHHVPAEDLVQCDEQRRVSKLTMRHPRAGAVEVDDSTLVVAIDAACRASGRPTARAAWAVYFGPGSCYNECGALPLRLPQQQQQQQQQPLDEDSAAAARSSSSSSSSVMVVPQTAPGAEIEALARAVQAVADITRDDITVREVAVRSHSEYLVRAMSEWIEEWIENRGRRESGGRVPNFEALSDVNDLVDEAEYGSAHGDGGGLEISFWHAPRHGFFSADWLVEYGFDGV